jgi:ubiquinone/menaquinone biosynthesis C-methylase UbiE
MTESLSLGQRIAQLMQHLAIDRAHFAVCMARDWHELLADHVNRVASLSLICPMGLNVEVLEKTKAPLLCIAGDRGRPARETERDLTKLPGVKSSVLRDYFSPPWADPIAQRTDDIGQAMSDFILATKPLAVPTIAPADGEFNEISYSIRGQGAPLMLLPLALAPSQWDPLIPWLSERFCTITLGGAHLGMVAHLESRAQSSYMRIIDQLIRELTLTAGQSVLEVGCGSGAILRRLARQTAGKNRIIGVDVNRYLLREAAALAKREGLECFIDFQEGDAGALPFPDHQFDATISCTVMEEDDADRMLGQFVRVTKPGGKVGAIVRSIDLPRWVNLPLGNELKQKVEASTFFGGNVNDRGCADTSLYRRMNQAGLVNVTMLPQWASHSYGERLDYLHERIAALLNDSERAEWQDALAKARSEGTFFISEPFHCAVGIKP